MDCRKILFSVFICAWQFPAYAQISHSPFQSIGKDSVITYISNRYKANSFLRNFLMGKNYRKEWSQPVTLPVFRMSATKFRIDELGGGMQTKSLKLEDSKGKDWTLRTIDKDVAGALSKFLEKTFVKKIAQDQISAAMPYGAPVVGSLAKSAKINAPQPIIYFVADDARLGPYRHLFANTICMLEERDPGFEDTDNTEDALRRILSSSSYVVDQKALLKARLLDMLVGDWDRHFDNWRWGVKDSAGLKYYHAIPRDRDWAFYYSDGLIPKLARVAALRFLVNFKERVQYIKSLNHKTYIFDRVFLNEMDASDWKEAIHEFQQQLNDKAIEQAVKQLPPPVFNLDGTSFIQKLKSRRDGLEKPVIKYYHYISKQVQIEGSGDAETFSIQPAEEGFLLQIYRSTSAGKKEMLKIYERKFLNSETYRVILNGLGGNDNFVIDENVKSKIKLKLNGGSGKDSYNLNGQIRIEANDTAAENNSVANKNNSKIYFR